MKKNERFTKVYSQGAMATTEIWVDNQTGVNYLFHKDGYAAGLEVLVDAQGNPIISVNEC